MDSLALADTVGRIYETVFDDGVERSWRATWSVPSTPA